MKVKVLKPFYDKKEGKDRRAGEIFECSAERYQEIASALPEWVETQETPKATPKKKTTSKKGK